MIWFIICECSLELVHRQNFEFAKSPSPHGCQCDHEMRSKIRLTFCSTSRAFGRTHSSRLFPLQIAGKTNRKTLKKNQNNKSEWWRLILSHLLWMSIITWEYVFPRMFCPFTFTSLSPGDGAGRVRERERERQRVRGRVREREYWC